MFVLEIRLVVKNFQVFFKKGCCHFFLIYMVLVIWIAKTNRFEPVACMLNYIQKRFFS